jgi:hypothetical protein
MQERPFTYHTRGDFSPAACLVSGRTENLIDLGAQDIYGYGRVYLDIVTFAELATAMGFIDGEQHKAMARTYDAELTHARTELATIAADRIIDKHIYEAQLAALTSTPNREALKEFYDGITDLVGGLTDRLFRPGDGVPDLPVPTDEQSAVVSDIGAVGSGKRAVPRRGKAKPAAGRSKPELDSQSGYNDADGDSEVTPASPPVGGSELHESAERDEPADGDVEPDLEGFFDPAGN